jgi:hypothetical protein
VYSLVPYHDDRLRPDQQAIWIDDHVRMFVQKRGPKGLPRIEVVNGANQHLGWMTVKAGSTDCAISDGS